MNLEMIEKYSKQISIVLNDATTMSFGIRDDIPTVFFDDMSDEDKKALICHMCEVKTIDIEAIDDAGITSADDIEASSVPYTCYIETFAKWFED